MLQRPSVPLFLQFKLSHKMVRRNAKEYVDGHIQTTPFFRMHIWTRTKSRQQELLMDLESAGEEVNYVAPAFFSDVELNDAYLRHTVTQQSIFVRPSVIGRLTDDEDHWVAFDTSLTPYVCSTPKRIDQSVDFKAFTGRIQKAMIGSRGKLTIDRVGGLLDTLSSAIANTASADSNLLNRIRSASKQVNNTREEDVGKALQQVAYVARSFLGCELFIASSRQ